MYKNRGADGTNNACGKNLKRLREQNNLSQRMLADKMQLMGLDIDRHVIRRIENGQRFVIDVEIKMLARALNASYVDLLD